MPNARTRRPRSRTRSASSGSRARPRGSRSRTGRSASARTRSGRSTSSRSGRSTAGRSPTARSGRTTRTRAAASRAQSAVALLDRDHRQVGAMMRRAQRDPDVFDDLKLALDVHARIEEEIFYPAVRNTDEGKNPVKEAQEEHRGVKQLLARMARTDRESGEFQDQLQELKQQVEHHVEEERREIFPTARTALSRQELAAMGRRLEQRKRQLMREARGGRPRAGRAASSRRVPPRRGRPTASA